MISGVLIITISLIGQMQPGSGQELPYRLIDKKTNQEFRAFVTDEELNGRGTYINVLLDEPWRDLKDRQQSLVREAYKIAGPANALLRGQAITDGWLAHGGVRVETISGTTIWVHGEEKEYAERASNLAAAQELPPEPQQSNPSNSLSDARSTSISFLDLWGAHLLVLGVSGAVIILVIWGLVLRQPAPH